MKGIKNKHPQDEPDLFNDKPKVVFSNTIKEYELPLFIKTFDYYECFISDKLHIFIRKGTDISNITICYNHYSNKCFAEGGFHEFLLRRINSPKNTLISAKQFYEEGLGIISDEFMQFQDRLFASLKPTDLKEVQSFMQASETPSGKDTIEKYIPEGTVETIIEGEVVTIIDKPF